MGALQVRMREDHDPEELSNILKAIYRGEPFVRVIDPATGLPRMATTHVVNKDTKPGLERPQPLSMLKPGERIAEIVYPTINEQMAAIKFVADYSGWKPASEVNMNVEHSQVIELAEEDFEDLPEDQLDAYLEVCRVMSAKKAKLLNPSGSPILEAESTEKVENE